MSSFCLSFPFLSRQQFLSRFEWTFLENRLLGNEISLVEGELRLDQSAESVVRPEEGKHIAEDVDVLLLTAVRSAKHQILKHSSRVNKVDKATKLWKIRKKGFGKPYLHYFLCSHRLEKEASISHILLKKSGFNALLGGGLVYTEQYTILR